MDKKTKSIIVIAGPTAVGKTSLSIKLAQKYNTVIVSADSRQFYQELEIGTAKPDAQELDAAPHYFINSLSIHDTYDVGQYEKEAMALLEKLFEKHEVVVVTGGSGLFIKALCDGLDSMPEVAPAIRDKWNLAYKEKGLSYLQRELQKVDQEYAQIVDLNNPMRLIRGLEVFEASGQGMSYWRSKSNGIDRPFNVIKIALSRDRAELYKRIDLRMDQMIAAGLFEEAEAFYPYRHLNALQTVGYTEVFGYLSGDYEKEEAVRLLKRNSRRYAKRQLTWFKKDEAFEWFHPESQEAIYDYVQQQINL